MSTKQEKIDQFIKENISFYVSDEGNVFITYLRGEIHGDFIGNHYGNRVGKHKGDHYGSRVGKHKSDHCMQKEEELAKAQEEMTELARIKALNKWESMRGNMDYHDRLRAIPGRQSNQAYKAEVEARKKAAKEKIIQSCNLTEESVKEALMQACNLTEEQAKSVVTAIDKGSIPSVRINY